MMLHSIRGGSVRSYFVLPSHNNFVGVSHDIKNHGSTTKPPPLRTLIDLLQKVASIRSINIQLVVHIPVEPVTTQITNS